MPQLDIGILVFELYLNFIFFWLLYIFLARWILPKIQKTLKLRKFKSKRLIFKYYIIKTKINLFLYLIKYIFNNKNFFLNKFFSEILTKFNLMNLLMYMKLYNLNYINLNYKTQLYINLIYTKLV